MAMAVREKTEEAMKAREEGKIFVKGLVRVGFVGSIRRKRGGFVLLRGLQSWKLIGRSGR